MHRRIVLLTICFTLGVGVILAQSDTTVRRIINLPRPVPNLPFSDGVLVGKTLYISGRLGFDSASGKIPADVDAEIHNLLDGIKQVLTKSEMTMDNLVYVQVFCSDISLYGKFNAAYREYFSKDFPARAFIGSGPLLFGAHFEIQAIADR